jgi:hypothetical protein
MAKFNYENSYFYLFKDEDFTIAYDFTNNIASGDSLSSATVSIADSNGTDYTSTMIANESVSSPDVTFTVQNPPASGVYEIKIVAVTANSNSHVGKIICEVFESETLVTYLAGPSSNSYVTLKEANDYIREIRGHTDTWDTLSLEGRKRALIQACKDIDKFNFIGKKYYDNQALEFPRDNHDTITGDCATPLTSTSFKCTSFTEDTYGSYKSNTNFWRYGTVHITAATPLYDIRNIDTSNITTDVITVTATFTATPTGNTDFIAFEPLDPNIKLAQCYQALHILENEGGNTLYNYKSAGAKEVQIGDVRVKFSGSGGSMSRNISSKAKQMLSGWIERYRKVLRA